MRRKSAAALIAVTLLLAGCDDAATTLRSGISYVARFLSGELWQTKNGSPKGCPAVQGSYALIAPTSTGGQLDLLSTFLGGGVHHAQGNPWRSVAIAGDASNELKLTFARPRQRAAKKDTSGAPSQPAYISYALEIPNYEAVDRHSTAVRPGVNYGCKNGWLTAEDGHSSIQIRRDSTGSLEARMTVLTPRVISVWAETGAGIPYWFDSKTNTVRWAAVSSSWTGSAAPPDTGNAGPPPRPSAGIAQQEWDLTYGSGPVASTTAAATAATRGDKPYDAQKEIRALIDRDAAVEKIQYEGNRYVVTLRVESRGQVTRTLENLRADAYMQDVQDHGVISGGTRPDVATISLRVVAPR